jgi:predicted alpha/beta hydrolase
MGASARLTPTPASTAPVREEIEIRTRDGITLRATVRKIPRSRGTCVLAHAMFARRSIWEKGFAEFLAARGWRSVSFDFRGHGDSDKTDDHGYDDLVFSDLPAVAECARQKLGGPLVVIGHSLGGHVALAAQGAGVLGADAIVGVAAPNVWLRELEPSRAVWAVKRGILATVDAVCKRFGRFPARRLGLGSDDEPIGYMTDLTRFGKTNAWRSRSGTNDYLAALARVKEPVCAIASDGDRLNARPECVRRMLDLAAGPKRFVHLRARVDHTRIVTTRDAESGWGEAMDWIASAL